MSDLGDMIKEIYDAGPPWPKILVGPASWEQLRAEFPKPPPGYFMGMKIYVAADIPADEIRLLSYDAEQREFKVLQIIHLGG